MAEADAIHWFFRREEARFHPVVDVLSPESYPVLFPSHVGERVVAVPFAGEEQEHVSWLYRNVLDMCRAEHSLALHVVEQLVFVERSSTVHVEIIAVGVSFCRIWITGHDMLLANGAHSESPFRVPVACQQVFACLHICISVGNNCSFACKDNANLRFVQLFAKYWWN